MAIYFIALPAAWLMPVISVLCYFTVAVIWLVPDKRLESLMEELERDEQCSS